VAVSGLPVIVEISWRRGGPIAIPASTPRSGAVHAASAGECTAVATASTSTATPLSAARLARFLMPPPCPATRCDVGVSQAASCRPCAMHSRWVSSRSAVTLAMAVGRAPQPRSTWPRYAASRAASVAGRHPAHTSAAISPELYPTAARARTPSRSSTRSPSSEAASSALCSAGVLTRPENASTIRPRAPAPIAMPGAVVTVGQLPVVVPVVAVVAVAAPPPAVAGAARSS